MKPIFGPPIMAQSWTCLIKDGRRVGIECKRADAPRITASMRAALEDLKLDRLIVLYPGDKAYSLLERVDVVPLIHLAEPDRFLKK